MSALMYRSHGRIEDLALNECTIHRASGSGSARWWQLWFHVIRDSDAQPEVFCVPVNPGSPYTESGPGGRTWGLNKPQASAFQPIPGTSNWMISPSINVLNDRDAVAGTHVRPSLAPDSGGLERPRR
jgi:hypothetical protein